MKSPYVSELQANQAITGSFLVQSKEVRQKKTGEPYLSLVLVDKTGDIEAKMWDNVAEVMDTFDRDDFIRLKGATQSYQNRLQITIHRLARLDDASVDFTDYFPASKRDRDEMFSELQSIVAGLQNPHLRALLQSFFADPQLAAAYRLAPAAKSVHHAFLGGLIEHVLSLCGLARSMAAHYPYVDLDLLLTGVILHDIGKLTELTYVRSFGYSDEGQLLGHIVIGLRMLGDKFSTLPDFPPGLRTLVEHMLISHHGELEFGSPKQPLFPEALLLHHLDNLDSKMECMRALIDKDSSTGALWTSYSPALARAAFRKALFLEKPQPAPAPTPTASPAAPAPPQQTGLFAEKLQGALRRRD
jgi:3'-5' exoribonuclease